MIFKKSPNAPVAQLDRVPVSETGGHRFDSCQARHFFCSTLLFFTNPCFADPLHWKSPDYIINSFIEIALKSEYSTKVSTLRKWHQPIYYSIEHRTADKKLHQEITEIHLAHLSHITGLSISPANNTKVANLKVIFSTESRLTQELQQDFLLNDQQQLQELTHHSVCLANFSTGPNNSIHQAIVIIPVDRARAHAKLLSCVVEELTQVMGLPNDSDKVFPSIFNDKSHDDYLSGLDYLLLRLLYNKNLKAGMKQAEVQSTLQKIIQDPAFQQHIEHAEQTVNQQGIFRLIN